MKAASLLCVMACASLVFVSAVPGSAVGQPGQRARGQEAAPAQSRISLLDSVTTTLREHRSLRSIQENRQVIVHERDRAEKGYYPRVDVMGAAGFAQNSDSTTRAVSQGADSEFYPGSRIGATLTQLVWDGHATRSKVRNAEATLDSVSQRVFDNATTLALDAIITHIDVSRTREIVRLSENNVKRHESLLRLVIDRQQTGADSLADVSQARSRLARAQTQATDAEGALEAAKVNYFRLTNRYVGSRELAAVSSPDFPYKTSDDVFSAARTHNPKLAALKADVRASVAGRELSEASYQPAINVEAGPSYMTKGSGGKASDWTRGVDAMLVLRWNVFSSGADSDAVKAASARIRQNRQSMYSFDDDLKSAVDNSWILRNTATRQTRFYAEAAKYSGETLNAYKEQFFLGQRSILDVLDAENELYNNAVQSVTARMNIPVSEYRLLALTGLLLPQLGVVEKDLLEMQPEDQGPAHAQSVR